MPKRLNPSALLPEDVTDVLIAAGSEHATIDAIRSDIKAGAPTNPDGTVNLVNYAAWLVREKDNGRSKYRPEGSAAR